MPLFAYRLSPSDSLLILKECARYRCVTALRSTFVKAWKEHIAQGAPPELFSSSDHLNTTNLFASWWFECKTEDNAQLALTGTTTVARPGESRPDTCLGIPPPVACLDVSPSLVKFSLPPLRYCRRGGTEEEQVLTAYLSKCNAALGAASDAASGNGGNDVAVAAAASKKQGYHDVVITQAAGYWSSGAPAGDDEETPPGREALRAAVRDVREQVARQLLVPLLRRFAERCRALLTEAAARLQQEFAELEAAASARQRTSGDEKDRGRCIVELSVSSSDGGGGSSVGKGEPARPVQISAALVQVGAATAGVTAAPGVASAGGADLRADRPSAAAAPSAESSYGNVRKSYIH